MLTRLVRWWLFERHRPKPKPEKVPTSDHSQVLLLSAGIYAPSLGNSAYANGLASGLANAYHRPQVPPFTGQPSMARYAPQQSAVAEVAKLVPPDWGAPQLIPADANGKPPGWQKGVDLGYAARDPQWCGDEKRERAVRTAVEEFVGLCKGHKLTAWRVIEHYDIRLDAYRLRLDAWGPR